MKWFFIILPLSVLEIAELCEALPPDKRDEVADFARFLLTRQQDERWESIIVRPKARPRLDAFLREYAAEADEALDPPYFCRFIDRIAPLGFT